MLLLNFCHIQAWKINKSQIQCLILHCGKEKKQVQHFNNNRPYKCFNWLALQKNYNLPTLSSNFGHPKQQSKHIHVQIHIWSLNTWNMNPKVHSIPLLPTKQTKKAQERKEKPTYHSIHKMFVNTWFQLPAYCNILLFICTCYFVSSAFTLVTTRIHTHAHKRNKTDMSRCPVQSHSKQKQIPHDVVVLAFTFLWWWKGSRP